MCADGQVLLQACRFRRSRIFDGYRILHFSDAHVGSYTGKGVRILEEAVRRINGINADAIVFTGDLQNMHPREIYPVTDILGRLRADRKSVV